MKKLLLFTLLTPTMFFAQTITTVADGDYYNPFSWDCTCVPTAGVDAIVNHDMTTPNGVLVDGGSLLINAGKSITLSAGAAGVFVTNGASLTNHGTFTIEDVTFSEGTTINSTGLIIADSLFNQGDFTNSGIITIYDIANDEVASLTNTGTVDIEHNFNNQGLVTNQMDISVGLDFSNCNTQALDAIFINNGTMCVVNDFANCEGDTLKGSGSYYAGGASGNAGVFDGTHTFYTPSGSLSLNTGTIEASVTISSGTNSCTALSINEETSLGFSTYPNPTTGNISIDLGQTYNQTDVKVLNMLGQTIFNQTYLGTSQINLNVDGNPGMYILEVNTEKGATSRISVLKK